jgi:predicted phage baseplate assembly protein
MTTALFVGKALFLKYANVSTAFTLPPAEGTTLRVPGGASVMLLFGFDGPTTQPIRLDVELFKPVPRDAVTNLPELLVTWHYSTGTTAPGSWPQVGSIGDGTDGFGHDGVVTLTLPATWDAQTAAQWQPPIPPASVSDLVADSLRWLGVRVANPGTAVVEVGVDWILFNAVSSHNALTIDTPERLGTGDGRAYQVFSLRNRPLYKRLATDTPYDHLEIEVGGQPWTQVDDFPLGDDPVYKLDPVTGDVLFGDYDPVTQQGHGRRPPAPPPSPPVGATYDVVAHAYRYVAGGAEGDVPGGAIQVLSNPPPNIVAARNLSAGFDGSDEEPVEDTKRRAPQRLRNRDRAVTADDFENLAREATTDVWKVRCLEPAAAATATTIYGDLDRAPGNVHVLVVPLGDPTEPTPRPKDELLLEVQAYLDRRREVTSHLRVGGPRYLKVKTVVDARVWATALASGLIDPNAALPGEDVYAGIEARIRSFFHPTRGGLEGRGWEIGQSVHVADLYKAIQPPEDVGYIAGVTIEPDGVLYGGPRPFPSASTTAGAWLRVADFELVCFGSLSVPRHGLVT